MPRALQICLAAAVCLLAFLRIQPKPIAPVFEGHSIAWWAEQHSKSGDRYEMSFRFVGADAAPVLARVLTSKTDSAVNQLLCSVWSKLPSPLQRVIPEPVLNAKRRRVAAFGLLEMEHRAAAAKPALVSALTDPDPRVRELAVAALERLEP